MRMEQHDGELTCGPRSHPRAGQRDTVRRDCDHRGSPHAHGTRAAYVSDRCGCTRCRAARRLLSYSLDPEAPPDRTRAATARRLLALPLATENGSPRRLVAADATRERIDALTAAGHSLTELARVIGKPPTSLRRSLSRRSVTAQTAVSVEALYESLGQPCLRRWPPDFPAQSSTFSNSRSSRGGSDFAWGGTPRSGFTRNRHPFDPDCTGTTSRKSRRVAANVAGFQQARRLNTSMARTGRPSKGDRDVLYTRVPRPVGDAIRALSDQTGMAISDVIAALAAKGLGMPEWAPQPPHPYDQQELPLKTA